jgi:acyl carrier protein
MERSEPLTRDSIEETVNRVVVEEFEAEPDELSEETRLREDVGLDSLDAVDLVIALELAFGFRIPEEEIKGIRTLGDIYERIGANSGSQDGSGVAEDGAAGDGQPATENASAGEP